MLNNSPCCDFKWAKHWFYFIFWKYIGHYPFFFLELWVDQLYLYMCCYQSIRQSLKIVTGNIVVRKCTQNLLDFIIGTLKRTVINTSGDYLDSPVRQVVKAARGSTWIWAGQGWFVSRGMEVPAGTCFHL